MGPLVAAALAAAGEGARVADGDTFVKTGGGTLIATNTWKDVKVNTRVEAGVYEARYAGDLSGGSTIAVRDGASLKINAKVGNGTQIAAGGRSFYLRGAGHPAAAVTKNGRTFTGALVFTGTANYQILNGCHFLADAAGEAVIASDCAGNEGYLTYGWLRPSAGALRLVGPGHVIGADGRAPTIYEHRYRYGYGYTNTNNKIVLDGAVLAGSSANYYARPNKVKLEVRNGGGVGPDNQSFLDAFSSIDFEWGTIMQGENAATITMPVFSGLPFLSATVTPTVNKAWTVSAADLLQGRCMGAFKALTFGANAKLRVTGAETLDCTAVYTVATSAVSVAGLPVFEANPDEPRRWKTTAGLDGKSVLLVYDPPRSEGVVNVRDWGVLPGAENAAANSSAFAAGLAQLTGTGNVVFFPQGVYFFDAPISVENASGLTLFGDDGFSQLQVTDAAAASVLSLTGGTDVTVTGLRFADCAGVAIAANGTASLTVTNNVYTNIVGALDGVADAVYPVAAADCTDLFVQNNRVKGGATYTSSVYAGGATTFKAGSEPSEVWVWSWPTLEDSLATVNFATALASLGYVDYPQGAKLVKMGTGRFQGTSSATVRDRLGEIDIREGTFVTSQGTSLGKSGNKVTIHDGATLVVEANGDTCSASGANITVGGFGAATSEGGSICLKSISWQCSVNCTFTLASDTAFRQINPGSCGFFSQCTINQQGHTLVLRGDGLDRQIRFRLRCLFKNSAPIIVSNCTVSASYKEGGSAGFSGENGVRPPLLKIARNAKLLLNNQDFSDVFAVYEFEPGAQLNAESALPLFTSNLVGAPTIQDNVTTYTVNGSFTARAADLVAGKSLTAAKAFALGANCTVDVDDPDALPLRANGRLAQYVLATAEGGIAGRPVKGANLAETTWQLRLVDGGKTLLLAQPESTFLILR